MADWVSNRDEDQNLSEYRPPTPPKSSERRSSEKKKPNKSKPNPELLNTPQPPVTESANDDLIVMVAEEAEEPVSREVVKQTTRFPINISALRDNRIKETPEENLSFLDEEEKPIVPLSSKEIRLPHPKDFHNRENDGRDRYGCNLPGYKSRHFRGAMAFDEEELELDNLYVRNTVFPDEDERTYIYNVHDRGEGPDSEEFLPVNSKFAKYQELFEAIFEDPPKDRDHDHLEEQVAFLINDAKLKEIQLHKVFHQALYVKSTLADLQEKHHELLMYLGRVDKPSSSRDGPLAYRKLEPLRRETKRLASVETQLALTLPATGDANFSSTSSSPAPAKLTGPTPETVGGLEEGEEEESSDDEPAIKQPRSRSPSVKGRETQININPGHFARLEDLEIQSILNFERDSVKHRSQDYAYDRNRFISEEVQEMIEDTLKDEHVHFEITDWKQWRSMSHERFFQVLRLCLGFSEEGKVESASNSSEFIKKSISAWKPATDLTHQNGHRTALMKLTKLAKEATKANLSKELQKELGSIISKTLLDNLKKKAWDEFTKPLKDRSKSFKTIDDGVKHYHDAFVQVITRYRNSSTWFGDEFLSGKREGTFPSSQETKKAKKGDEEALHAVYEHPRKGQGKSNNPKDKKPPKTVPAKPPASTMCRGCGRKSHSHEVCTWKRHPNWNDASLPWGSSKVGRLWLSEHKAEVLKPSLFLDGTSETQKTAWKEIYGTIQAGFKTKQPKGEEETLHDSLEQLHAITDCPDDASDSPESCRGNPRLPIIVQHADGFTSCHRALIDTGAEANSYIARGSELERLLIQHGAPVSQTHIVVNGALKGDRRAVGTRKFKLNVKFYNESIFNIECLIFRATVIDLSNSHELIIGMPTIARAQLLAKVEQQLYGVLTAPLAQPRLLGQLAENEPSRTDHVTNASVSPNASNEDLVGKLVQEPARNYLDPVDHAEGVDLKDVDTPWQRVIDGERCPVAIPLKVYGTELEKARINALLREFEGRFSLDVSKEPAKVDPLEIDVDLVKWKSTRGNQGGARVVSQVLQPEIQRQTNSMLDLNVIQVSTADRHSQVLMVKKPLSDPPKYRMCIDYVLLNDCTRTVERWPLPHIPEMIQRIGRERS